PVVYRSSDGGKTFEPLPGAVFPSPRFVVVAPSDPDVLYAGRRGGRMADIDAELHRSGDGGRTWQAVQGAAHDIDINPTNPNHLVGVTCRGVIKSTDGGASWRDVHAPMTGDATRLTRGVNDRTTLYATHHSEGGSW